MCSAEVAASRLFPREGIRAERDAIAPLSKSVEVSEERIRAGLRQHVVWDEQARYGTQEPQTTNCPSAHRLQTHSSRSPRSFEEDLARAIAQLRYAQAVARAYPPERTAEGSLLVAKVRKRGPPWRHPGLHPHAEVMHRSACPRSVLETSTSRRPTWTTCVASWRG